MSSPSSQQSNNNHRCNDGEKNFNDSTTSASCSDGEGCNQKPEETVKSAIIDPNISHDEARVRNYLNLFFQSITPNDRNEERANGVSTNENPPSLITIGEDMAKKTSARVECCGSSQSLYCKFCCRLLVPDDLLPPPISLRKRLEGNCFERDLGCKFEKVDGGENKIDVNDGRERERPLRIPFDLHIILDDRRGGSTGLHAVALLDERYGNHSDGAKLNPQQERISSDGNGRRGCGETVPIRTKSWSEEITHTMDFSKVANSRDRQLGSIALIDVKGGDIIPDYHSQCTQTHFKPHSSTTRIDNNSTTFLLFPCPGESVPINSIADKIQTLVVLDCKWTRSNLSKSKELSCLQKVHLTFPPEQSYFWRWHNAGRGMMSTIEAIYYAALETLKKKDQQLLKHKSFSEQDVANSEKYQSNLIHLLWIFGHQRVEAYKGSQKEGKPPPWSVEGKELQRMLRKQKGTWKQQRDKQVGKSLKEESRLRRRMKTNVFP